MTNKKSRYIKGENGKPSRTILDSDRNCEGLVSSVKGRQHTFVCVKTFSDVMYQPLTNYLDMFKIDSRGLKRVEVEVKSGGGGGNWWTTAYVYAHYEGFVIKIEGKSIAIDKQLSPFAGNEPGHPPRGYQRDSRSVADIVMSTFKLRKPIPLFA